MNPIRIPRRAALGALAVTGLALLNAGCAAPPQVRVDQDPEVDLRAYKTFAFFDAPASSPTSLIGRHLTKATREHMERQHYVYSEQGPDLRVAIWLAVVDHPELRSTTTFRHYGWGGVETAQVRDGTLRIGLVDTRRNALVWQGVAEGRVDGIALRRPAETVQRAVAEIFAHYGQPAR